MKTCDPEGVLPTIYSQALGITVADIYLGVLQVLGPSRAFEALEITSRLARDFLAMQLSELSAGDSSHASSPTTPPSH